jgi:hypothetical protein
MTAATVQMTATIAPRHEQGQQAADEHRDGSEQ